MTITNSTRPKIPDDVALQYFTEIDEIAQSYLYEKIRDDLILVIEARLNHVTQNYVERYDEFSSAYVRCSLNGTSKVDIRFLPREFEEELNKALS